ncbi:hypothetical protein RW1_014_01850 [Rhodococcus wratislaviensis NBRC 100605]|uniref:Uncharacterized protein n=1 Tax=Rhodococcus wratislaviensis NBRC 100605 TaxID=1219028 RepID=X0Q1E5_RHOWR|nr:hypothetical protein RW1_014_01850 [Rhodococcus wratislaviensis NBRC 100605]
MPIEAHQYVGTGHKSGNVTNLRSALGGCRWCCRPSGASEGVEVAAGFDPLVVRLGEDSFDESDNGSAIGEESLPTRCSAGSLFSRSFIRPPQRPIHSPSRR